VTALLAEKSLLKPQILQNAVFLGKNSRAIDCDSKSNDTHPFGCDLLKDLAAEKGNQYLSQTVTATTDVNIRMHAPIVVGQQSTWACTVRTLSQGDKIELNGILRLQYAGDTFYWGTVGGDLQQCNPTQ
jgi:hypothetical protein